VPQPRRSPGAERTGVDGGAKRMGSSGGSRCGRREGAVAAADGGAWAGEEVKSEREYSRGEASARRGGGVDLEMQRVDGGRELWGGRPMTRRN
jgi:hypothetical protein